MTTRAYAQRAVRAINAPLPTQEGTLHVTGVPAYWPTVVVAKYVLRAALELGCARIAVHRPATSPVVFDVVELLTGVARAVGYWPRPALKVQGPLHGFALAGFRQLGSGIDRVRRWITVPAFPGLNPAQKEG